MSGETGTAGAGLFRDALARRNLARPPVWFMRQAGRYHAHYQALRSRHSFVDLCRRPDLARETALGPIEDFGFDAAIVFCDLLFPLESMGMSLEYSPGPKLGHRLLALEDVRRLGGGASLAGTLDFQAEAVALTRAAIPRETGMIGFVGGPWTLFLYGVTGSHLNDPASALRGLDDGRYALFVEKISGLLAEAMFRQARAGADLVLMIDTGAGVLDAANYRRAIAPSIAAVIERFDRLCRERGVSSMAGYYSKGTGPGHWDSLKGLPIGYMGVDWNHDISEVLARHGDLAVQGNFDPHLLLLPEAELEPKARAFLDRVAALDPAARKGWVCGLGHGVLPGTPEANIRLFLRLQKEIFGK